MSARRRPFAAGNLFRRMMTCAEPCRRGSRSKRSSASSRQFSCVGVAFFDMPYHFAENEFELEPEASPARGGGPPRKLTGAGGLDPPFSPKRPPGSIPTVPSSLLFRIVAGLVLAGLATALFFLLFALR